MENRMPATMLIGVGCQKGGTSWIADHLRGHPHVRGSFTKEVHALDVHFLPQFADWHAKRIVRGHKMLADLPRDTDDRRAAAEAMESRIRDHEKGQALAENLEHYARYFKDLAAQEPKPRLVFDITPSYAALRADHWVRVRETLLRHDFTPRIVLVMRDPIARLHSAFRMAHRNAEQRPTLVAGSPGGDPRRTLRLTYLAAREAVLNAVLTGADPRRSRFLAFATDEINLARSRYDLTMEAVETAFDRAQIHYAFFEELFTEREQQRLAGFLGIDPLPADFGRKVNASPGGPAMRPAEVAYLRERLAPAYDACAQRFGAERIRALWKHF
jgi:hypothetical protein